MRAILLGAPGAGKGTQAERLAARFSVPRVSVGDMLRAAVREGTSLGLKVKQVMEAGALVSDDLIIKLIEERLSAPDCSKGYLLDGFPRTLAQAEALNQMGIAFDYIIEIVVADEEVVARLSGRLVHPGSGRIYHLVSHPPHHPGMDDITGEPLVQRKDDQEETVRARLKVYHETTELLVDYYTRLTAHNQGPKYLKIDGVGTVDEVTARLIAAL